MLVSQQYRNHIRTGMSRQDGKVQAMLASKTVLCLAADEQTLNPYERGVRFQVLVHIAD